MKYVFWILLLFAAAVALSISSHNPAYVLLVYPPYRIELSLTLFVALLLLAFVFGYALLRLMLAATQLPAYVRKFRLERAQAKARRLLDEALGAFFEGRYAEAEKAAAQAMESGERSALYAIIAARSAHELNEYEKRDAYLSSAEEKSVGDVTMRLMATSKFMLDQRDAQAALKALQELRDSGVKNHPGALSLELKAQQQAGNWNRVLDLLEQLEKRKAIDVTAAAQLRQQAWLENIRQQESLDGMTDCLAKIPSDFKRRSKIITVAVQQLIRFGGCSQAQQLLTDSLNAQWDSELVALFGNCEPPAGHSGNVIAQIEQAEKWLKFHKEDAGLLLALGRLCLYQGLWGKAQSYLDASLSIMPGKEAYAVLVQLAERMGKPEEAAKYRQRAAALK